ncbi:MAG: 50S ribosomal protein L14e, partial [Nanoarchaeota archaeon]|nr:50S ribosomal protein L14e [Nanoarchaeota archaeon]
MFLFEIGRMCIKIAGRDAGLKCVVVDIIDDTFVLIDGQTRRRKCNVKHLEPLKEVVKLKKNASRSTVFEEFKKLKIDVKETKPKKPSQRPLKQKKKKEQPVSDVKEVAQNTKIATVKPKIEKKDVSKKEAPKVVVEEQKKEKK